MKVYKDIADLPAFSRAVITIGTFDGVHLGHGKIIQQLIEEARTIKGTPVLITFYPHPKHVIESVQKHVFVLNTPEEKYELLKKGGINNIVVVPFNEAFAEQPALSYIRNFLVDKFHPHTIIIGYDHRFGKNREGNYKLLEKEAEKSGFIVKEIPEQVLHNITISSTKIREALLTGDVDTANNFLGYNYFFRGTVIEGNKLGRTLGYPTANLQVEYDEKLIPGNGVYAVDIRVTNIPGIFKGMMNIGIRPTLGETKRVIEVNIFDFDAAIYGSNVTVYLKEKLRDEIKFTGLEELKAQLEKDKEQASPPTPLRRKGE